MKPALPVAVLAPELHTRLRLRRALHALGRETAAFDRVEDLVFALGTRRHFAMLALAPEGSADAVRSEVERLRAFAEPHTPLMLVVSLQQVEAVMSVIGVERNDYLLTPVAEDELRDRLRRLLGAGRVGALAPTEMQRRSFEMIRWMDGSDDTQPMAL